MNYFNCQNPDNRVNVEHNGACTSWFSSTKYEECNKPCFGSKRPICGSDLRPWLSILCTSTWISCQIEYIGLKFNMRKCHNGQREVKQRSFSMNNLDESHRYPWLGRNLIRQNTLFWIFLTSSPVWRHNMIIMYTVRATG